MKEWKGTIKYKFAKIKEQPITSICEDCIAMPKWDGETTFLFFDFSLNKWITVNNWGHYRSDYKVTEEAMNSSLERKKVYVGELIFGKNLYDFLRHKKDGDGLRLVLFEVYEDANPSARKSKMNFLERLDSIPLLETYLEDGVLIKNDKVHLAKVPYYYHHKENPDALEHIFEKLTKTYEGIVVRGLTSEWVMKIKRKRTVDVVVMGMQKKGKSWERNEMGSLLVGLYHKGKLLKVGTVGSGFKASDRKQYYDIFMKSKIDEDKHYVYVSPKVVIEIFAYDFIETKEYDSKVTFRSPIFHRWRFDKPSSDCELFHQMPEALRGDEVE
jgi:hypothetical protein